jgi:hypothetical protein
VNTEGPKTFKNSIIRNNTTATATATTNGGGIYIDAGPAADGAGLTITHCVIVGN